MIPIPVLSLLVNSSAAVCMTQSERHAGPAEKLPRARLPGIEETTSGKEWGAMILCVKREVCENYLVNVTVLWCETSSRRILVLWVAVAEQFEKLCGEIWVWRKAVEMLGVNGWGRGVGFNSKFEQGNWRLEVSWEVMADVKSVWRASFEE